mgnify:CR=1 FL=1
MVNDEQPDEEEQRRKEALDAVNSPEFKQYLDELWTRLPGYGEHAAAIRSEAPGSVEQLGRIGKYWWQAREAEGLTRYEVAERMGVPVNQVRFLEVGMGSEEEREILPVLYANALGKPDLYVGFLKQFGLEPPRDVYMEFALMPPGDGNRVLSARNTQDLEHRLNHWNFFVDAHTQTMTPEAKANFRQQYPVVLSLEKVA